MRCWGVYHIITIDWHAACAFFFPSILSMLRWDELTGCGLVVEPYYTLVMKRQPTLLACCSLLVNAEPHYTYKESTIFGVGIWRKIHGILLRWSGFFTVVQRPHARSQRKRKEQKTHRYRHRSKMNVIKSSGFHGYRILYQVLGINQSPSIRQYYFGTIVISSSPSIASRIAPPAPEMAWLT